MLDFEIAEFTEKHLDSVIEIEKACFSVPWSRESFISVIKNPDAHYFVALSANAVVGYAGMFKVLNDGQITNIAVLPSYRRQGIAGALIDRLIAFSDNNGISFMTLDVRSENSAARSLYTQKGFKEVGKRKGYYTRPNDDAILMTLERNNP